jgi:hypothetical protein
VVVVVMVVKWNAKSQATYHRLACILTNAKQEQNQSGKTICC